MTNEETGSSFRDGGRRAPPVSLELALIVRDPEFQVRGFLDEAAVATFATAMQAGDVFPPVVVYCEGARYWLSQGFHRCAAAERAGLETISAVVRSGTRLDAGIDATGSNQEGDKTPLFRDHEQKRIAVDLLLKLTQGKWSDNKCAAHVGVAQSFVSKRRQLISEINPDDRRVGTDGKSYSATGNRSPRETASNGDTRHEPLPGQTSFLDDDDEDDEETSPGPRRAPAVKSGAEKCGEDFEKRAEQWSILLNTVDMYGGIVEMARAWSWSKAKRDQMAVYFMTLSREFERFSGELKEGSGDGEGE